MRGTWRGIRDEELRRDRDERPIRHAPFADIADAERPNRENDDPLRGKSDGEILMRYEF